MRARSSSLRKLPGGPPNIAGEAAWFPAPSAFTDSVVTQVARFVSMGQLPSSRAEASRNSTPLCVTG